MFVFAFKISGSRALFIRPTNYFFFNKNNFKIGFHSTIHIFKNYFVIVLSVFNFQFSAISGIQIEAKSGMNGFYYKLA